jgi:hypothetical protein
VTKVAKVLDVETSSWYDVAPVTEFQLAVIWLQVAPDPAWAAGAAGRGVIVTMALPVMGVVPPAFVPLTVYVPATV